MKTIAREIGASIDKDALVHALEDASDTPMPQVERPRTRTATIPVALLDEQRHDVKMPRPQERDAACGGISEHPVVHLDGRGRTVHAAPLSTECGLTVVLDGLKVTKLMGSPEDGEELAVGYLSTAGLISEREDILDVRVDSTLGIASVDTRGDQAMLPRIFDSHLTGQGFARGTAYRGLLVAAEPTVHSDLRVTIDDLLNAVEMLEKASTTHKRTHGTHSAALYGGGRLRIFREDIGRHNAIDKVYGACLLDGIPTADRVLLTSGRVWSETVCKAARRQTPIIVSIAPPTAQAVEVAERAGVTVVMVKGGEIDVYSQVRRIVGC